MALRALAAVTSTVEGSSLSPRPSHSLRRKGADWCHKIERSFHLTVVMAIGPQLGWGIHISHAPQEIQMPPWSARAAPPRMGVAGAWPRRVMARGASITFAEDLEYFGFRYCW